jgi:hypothetical protein
MEETAFGCFPFLTEMFFLIVWVLLRGTLQVKTHTGLKLPEIGNRLTFAMLLTRSRLKSPVLID